MRLIAVQPDGFVEYGEHVFSEEHQEASIQAWMEHNPQSITDEGGLLIIGREVTTDLGAHIDLLGVDRAGSVVVVELKKGQTPRETLAQALEYAAFVSTLGSEELESLFESYSGEEGVPLASAHRQFFELSDDEAVAFSKDQRIVLVAADVSPAIHASAEYLNRCGLRVTCLEFGYFRTATGEELLSTDIVVDDRLTSAARTTSAKGPRTNREAFLASCDDAGRTVFQELLAVGERDGFVVNWGSRGFSLRANIDGTYHTLCYGFPLPTKPGQDKQTIVFGLAELERDLPATRDRIRRIRSELLSTQLFAAAGKGSSVRYNIAYSPPRDSVQQIVDLTVELAEGLAAAAARGSEGTNGGPTHRPARGR